MGTLVKPHAVVIPYPAQGHISPLMHLSVKLAAAGFTITFVNTQHNHDLLTQTTHFPPDHSLDIRFVGLPDGRDHGRTTGQESIEELTKAWLQMGPVLSELIAKLLQNYPPATCLVSDLFGVFTQDVAHKFGLPRLAYWTASATTIASVMAIKQGFRPPTDSSELITWVPGAPPLKLCELNTYVQRYDPDDFMFNFFLEPYSRLGETTWIAINSFEELEQDALAALRKENERIYTVGPVLPASFLGVSTGPDYQPASLRPVEHDCLKWLDKQRAASVLFVSFGSITVLSRQQFEELALGLEASEQPLLWVIRSDLLYGESALFPEGYLERVKDRAYFVSWAPQLQVLSHEATGGFLTHAGWNSTLESVAAGVPMLGWPYFADQMLNSRCAVDMWRVALEFEAGEDGVVGRCEVEKKVRDLMTGDKATDFREKANKLKAVALEAVRRGGSSRVHWDSLVHSMSQTPPCE